MRKVYIIVILIILSICSFMIFRTKNEPMTLEALQTQLHGGKCRFSISYSEIGYLPIERGRLDGLSRRNDASFCIIDAVKLLTLIHGKDIDVVPTLIEALRTNYNIDSGDGIIPIRSEIALALGKIGDKRALPALQEILISEDLVILSKTGNFPSGYEIQKGSSHSTVKTAIDKISSE